MLQSTGLLTDMLVKQYEGYETKGELVLAGSTQCELQTTNRGQGWSYFVKVLVAIFTAVFIAGVAVGGMVGWWLRGRSAATCAAGHVVETRTVGPPTEGKAVQTDGLEEQPEMGGSTSPASAQPRAHN